MVTWKFLKQCRCGPDYVCVCCFRLMYRQTVLQYSSTKYKLAPCITGHRTLTSEPNSVTPAWICVTCDRALKRGSIPAQADVNHLQLQEIPNELLDMNKLEVRLISLRIPFMKMVILPRGKQRAIHGPAVNVPTDLVQFVHSYRDCHRKHRSLQ